MARGDAHRPRFTVQAIAEAQCARASTDVPLIGFEYRHAMAALLEFVGGGQARQARTDNDDVQRS